MASRPLVNTLRALAACALAVGCSKSPPPPPPSVSPPAAPAPAPRRVTPPFYGANPLAEAACKAGGAVYASFTNTCADTCGPPERACGEAMTDACDCGPGKCWDGSGCVADR